MLSDIIDTNESNFQTIQNRIHFWKYLIPIFHLMQNYIDV